jgi:probable rRNA maturation factor
LRIVEEDEGRRLNGEYRRKEYATNVLTFEYGPDTSIEGSPMCGDIVLCAPVVAREAAEQGKALDAHYAHLVVHGMLHLQGYDHEEASEAAVMEALESFVMMRMGFPDPYLDHE